MKPFICGICGGSGSGKSTLAAEIQKILGADQVGILAQDSYYLDQSKRFDGDGGSVNFDHPDSLDFALLAEHLKKLKACESIQVPRYDFKTHSRLKESPLFSPKNIVLVDGTLLLSQPRILEILDLSVFVDTPEPERFERRLKRDTLERGRTAEGVKKQFSLQVKPMHDTYIEPNKNKAQLLVSGLDQVNRCAMKVIKLFPNL